MATLVLTAVGTALGGPVGGAIGAIIGQQIDQSVFGTTRQGPRLNDLAVQTSHYGSKIPKIYGTMRVSGVVIWATDLKESSQTSGSKSARKTTYSYSVSLAVMLSARPITRIGRIWADGNLLRGAAGDWKSQTGFTLYTGSENQPVDPLMASAEGMGHCPAYRGAAYAVFSDMQLANFGNRIPSLSFEVFADNDTSSLQAVIDDLSDATVQANCPTAFSGYAANGTDVRAAIETLTAAMPVRVRDDGQYLHIEEASSLPQAMIAARDLGAAAGQGKAQKRALTRHAASTIDESLVIEYYDGARDYQQGMQRARRAGGARKSSQLSLPVTLDAATAKALVENQMSRNWSERVTAKITLPWRYLGLQTGQALLVPGSAETWRISALHFNKMVLEASLVRTANESAGFYTADAGRPLAELDLPAGPTSLILLDLPLLGDGMASAPIVAVAAAGVSPGWRGAALSQSLDNGGSYMDAGWTAAVAVIGHATAILGGASAYLIDQFNTITVQLLNADMLLQDADEQSLLAGANLAMLGHELIQFGRATPLGGGIWQLSTLLRGRRGTEDAIATHLIGECFTLLTSDTLRNLPVPVGTASVQIMAHGVGDTGNNPTATYTQPILAVRPPTPVALKAVVQPNGDIQITWIRRSRDGWRWVDGVDAPLVEEQELYQLTFTFNNGTIRNITSGTPSYLYTAQNILADKAAGATVCTLSVAQIGTLASSLPVMLNINLV